MSAEGARAHDGQDSHSPDTFKSSISTTQSSVGSVIEREKMLPSAAADFAFQELRTVSATLGAVLLSRLQATSANRSLSWKKSPTVGAPVLIRMFGIISQWKRKQKCAYPVFL
jgi:hypothetical protein